MSTPLVKTTSILVRVPSRGDDVSVAFEYANDPRDGWSRHRLVALDTCDWVDMGSPEVVTVTIEPGDMLNEEAA